MLIASVEDQPTNIRSSDRVLVLKPLPGKSPKNSTGMVDSRLFSGDNKLHAVMDKQTMFWSLKYDSGAVPEPLKGNYTTFRQLIKVAEDYFKKRDIEIVEVKD